MGFEKTAVIVVCVMLSVIGIGIGDKINKKTVLLKLLILSFCWFFLVIYQSHLIENVITILTKTYTSNLFTNFTINELHNGDKITGQFTAWDNYLGVIGIRFWNFYRINEDAVTFRIKEHGQKSWLYQHTYQTDQFQPNDYFTIGFPVISDSKNKRYDIEIESVGGEPGSAIGLSKTEPPMISKYQYPKSQLLTSRPLALIFILKKFLNLLASSDFSIATVLFIFPLLIQIVLYHFQSKVNSYFGLIKTIIYKILVFFLYGEEIIIQLSKIITKSELDVNYKRVVLVEKKADQIISRINRSMVVLILLLIGMLINTIWYPRGEITVLLLLGLTLLLGLSHIINRVHITAACFITLLLTALSYYVFGTEISQRFSVWTFILWGTLFAKSFVYQVTHKSS